MSEQTLFFKATRPDGTDFYTGTVDYGAALASGDTIRLDSDETEFPGPGWLHLATVPTECDGMTWPCRLFEVEPVGDVHHDEDHPHKIGCREVRVLRELPAHEAFGPQGEQVAALIERARCLTAAEIKRLHAAWYAAWDAAWYAAGDAARSLVARDLISTDAYDTLTRPWGEVIGPIHPDDPDMRRGA